MFDRIMKYFLPILISLLIFSCSSIDYIVESDFSYDGNFNRYRSFSFAKNGNFVGSDEERNILENYLSSTLRSWGYNGQERKPDLYIFYNVYYDDFNFPGFNQPDFQNWLLSNYSENEVVFKKDTLDEDIVSTYSRDISNNLQYEHTSYKLKEGTVLISLFDRRKRKTVWQGYASGVFGANKERNERIMKSAIIRIMDEYKLLAFKSS